MREQCELAQFDDPEVLEYPWDLSPYDAAPTADDLTALGAALKVSEGGEIDIDDAGHVVSRFLPELQRDLGLVYQPENWDEVRIATWLCRNLPEPSLTHASKQAFVAASSWIGGSSTVLKTLFRPLSCCFTVIKVSGRCGHGQVWCLSLRNVT